MVYLLWKLIHVLSVVIFLGNITTGLFWAARSHKSKDFGQIAATFKSIIQADRFFTIPGVIGITAAGMFATVEASIPMLSTGWVFWAIVLFIISGILFGVYVAPLQKKIVLLAGSNDMTEENWSAYEKLYDKWEFWGFLALLTPVAAAVIMVLKPALPGL